MHISGSELAQFELREVLGEGADFQVFAGRHLDTGADVVFKRPHPTLVSRNQHQEVEAAIHDLARIRSELNGEIPHTPVPLSLSGPAGDGPAGCCQLATLAKEKGHRQCQL